MPLPPKRSFYRSRRSLGESGDRLRVEPGHAGVRGRSLRRARGSFRQPVPFVELTTRPDAALRVSGAGGETLLEYADDAVYWTKRVAPEVVLTDSEMVFVGYGIVEPAVDWNDYAGLDMRGKTAVILVNVSPASVLL